MDERGHQTRSLEEPLAASCEAFCLALLELVQCCAAEGSGLDVAASDRDDVQNLLKLFAFYAVEWS